MMQKQSAMSLIGMLLVLAVVVSVGITTMQIIPVYIQQYTVKQSMETLKKQPPGEFSDNPAVKAQQLRSKLTHQLSMNGIQIPQENINIKPGRDGKIEVSIRYDITRPFVGNLYFLFKFDETIQVDAHGE